jgi:hypothetical protein
MAKAKKVFELPHTPPPKILCWYIGEHYYKRLQPIPYSYKKINKEAIKNILDINLKTYL